MNTLALSSPRHHADMEVVDSVTIVSVWCEELAFICWIAEVIEGTDLTAIFGPRNSVV